MGGNAPRNNYDAHPRRVMNHGSVVATAACDQFGAGSRSRIPAGVKKTRVEKTAYSQGRAASNIAPSGITHKTTIRYDRARALDPGPRTSKGIDFNSTRHARHGH